MDKVIIDGVDVSECKNFIPVYTEDTDIEINNCCTLTYTPCQFEKKDCYYKQLQKLKHQYADVLKLAKENADSNEYCLQELEQENEQLKKEVETWNYQADKRAELYTNQYNRLIEQNHSLQAEIKQLKAENKKKDDLIESITRGAVEIQRENERLSRMENGKLKIKNEVLIDGVDVSGCCYYESKNDTGEWCDLTCTRDNAPVFRCEKMPNCQYKRLKRLEQFLKEIEKEITTYRLKYDTTHTASKLLDSLASKIRKELYE